MADGDNTSPQGAPELRPGHKGDAVRTKIADKVDAATEKKNNVKPSSGGDHEKQGPAGGFDATSVSRTPPGYTLKFTFHRARDLPPADVHTLSSDPYLVAYLNTNLPLRHKEDPRICWRTPTVRRTLEPEWNSEWIVAHVPASGFQMKCRLYDEDPVDHDDRIGNIHLDVDQLNDDWEGIREQACDIRKRAGSKRAYLLKGCAAMFSRSIKISGQVFVSVEMLGKSKVDHGGRMYTVGPCQWSKHFSPLIGRLAGTKDAKEVAKDSPEKKTEKYNFEANQVQLAGPVPEDLYHRYVEFKSFVQGMFTSHSPRGRILNRALHHQHARIYNYDRSTVYGSFPSPSKDMTLQFLDLVHFDCGGRIFTYVISLDGQWRFTETGNEFGIDLLSKHTMHSDVSIYIAFSGEFFIRRLRTPWKDPEEQETHPPDQINSGPLIDAQPKDPAYYQLVIDNDSGTYRPNADLLLQLREFLHRNLPGLKITTLDCISDKEKMEKMKKEQLESRKTEGENKAFVQGNSESISSSDEEDLDAVAAGQANEKGQGKEKESGKLGKVAQGVPASKNKAKEWAEGGKERAEREEEEDEEVAAGPVS